MPSHTAQPNPTKNPAPESDALDNTLEKLAGDDPPAESADRAL